MAKETRSSATARLADRLDAAAWDAAGGTGRLAGRGARRGENLPADADQVRAGVVVLATGDFGDQEEAAAGGP